MSFALETSLYALLKHTNLEQKSILDLLAIPQGTRLLENLPIKPITAIDPFQRLKRAWSKEKLLLNSSALPFNDNAFDLIIGSSIDSLPHAVLEMALSEYQRILKAQGSLLLVVENSHDDKYWQLKTTLESFFIHTDILSIVPAFGSYISYLEPSIVAEELDLNDALAEEQDSRYFLAIASQGQTLKVKPYSLVSLPAEAFALSTTNQSTTNDPYDRRLLADRRKENKRLLDEMLERALGAERDLSRKTRELDGLREEFDDLRHQKEQLKYSAQKAEHIITDLSLAADREKEDIKRIQEEKDRIEAELIRINAQRRELTLDVERLELQRDAQDRATERHKLEVLNLKETLEEKQEKITHLHSDRDRLREELLAETENHAKAKRNILLLEERIKRLEEEYALKIQRSSTQENPEHLAQKNEEMKRMQYAYQSLENELKELHDEHKELFVSSKTQRQKWIAKETELNRSRDDILVQNAELSSRVRNFSTETDALKTELQDLNSRIHDIESRYDFAIQELNEAKQELSEKDRIISNLESASAIDRRDLFMLQKENKHLAQQLETDNPLQSPKKSPAVQNESSNALKQIQNKLDSAQKEKETISQQLEQLETLYTERIESLTKRLAEQSQSYELERDIRSSEMAFALSQLEHFESQVWESNDAAIRHQARVAAVQANAENEKEEQASLIRDMNALADRLVKEEKKRKDLENELDHRDAGLEELHWQLLHAKSKEADICESKIELEDQLNRAKRAFEHVQLELRNKGNLGKNIDLAQDEKDHLHQESVQLEARVFTLSSLIQEQEEQLKKEAQKVKALEKERTNAVAKAEKLAEEIKPLKEQEKQLRKTSEKISKDARNLVEQYQNNHDTNDHLPKIEKGKDNLKKQSNELRDAEEKLADYENQLKNLSEEHSELKNKLSKSRADLAQAEKIHALQQQELRDQLAELQKEKQSAQNRALVEEERRQRIEHELKNAKHRLATGPYRPVIPISEINLADELLEDEEK